MELPPVQVREKHTKPEFVENAKFRPPDPIDYTSTTTTLTFGPSITRQEVTISITNDDVVESIEDFFATISLQTGGANVLIAPSSTQVRIDDDDSKSNKTKIFANFIRPYISVAAATPEFELPDYTVPENGGELEVCVMVPAGQIERGIILQLVEQSGTATSECSVLQKDR